ncbi:hypothetical protein ACMDCT_07080 [Halomonadaceae bacterium KBTZ08]
MSTYQPIPTVRELEAQHIAHPQMHADLSTEAPATTLLIDFREQRPPVIDGHLEAGEAKIRMRMADSALKLVLNPSEDCVGLLTLKDVLGRKAMARAHEMRLTPEEVPIHEIMQPIGRLPAISMEDLEAARVGDLVHTFNDVHEEHMLVTEDSPEGTSVALRGVIPASHVTRRLQVSLDSRARASSFAEIVRAVNGEFD